MAVSSYFNLHKNNPEQNLVEDLIVEAIRNFGYDVVYIPRERNAEDPILKEDASSEYNSAYPVEMYIKSFDGFQGDGQFMSRFGIEIRHQITFTVAIRTFLQLVGDSIGTTRPLEGDLIYFAMDNKLFQIQKVDKYSVFYQAGSLQTYDLVCEVFEYAGEKLNTGIEEVDAIGQRLSTSTERHGLRDANGALILDAEGRAQFPEGFDVEDALPDHLDDSEEIKTEADELIDFDEDNPLSEDF